VQAEEYSVKKLVEEQKSKKEAFSLTATELKKLLSELDRVLNPQVEAKKGVGKNPFLPEIKPEKDDEKKEKTKKEKKPLELSGIVIHKNQRYIIVGEEIFRVGDLVQGKRILLIKMGKVVLLSDGKIESLLLE